MKVLVDAATGNVKGTYTPPLNFSVSGGYVVDFPDVAGPVPPVSGIGNLQTAKSNAMLALHPSFSEILIDELIDLTNVDLVQSSRLFSNPATKGTILPPGGVLVTQQLSLTPPLVTRVFLHWYGFTLGRPAIVGAPQPSPAPLLYNYDLTIPGFVEFDPGSFRADILDSSGVSVLLSNVTPDAEIGFSLGASLCRLRFTNTSATPYHFSDWVFLVG